MQTKLMRQMDETDTYWVAYWSEYYRCLDDGYSKDAARAEARDAATAAVNDRNEAWVYY